MFGNVDSGVSRKESPSTGMGDIINSKMVEGAGSQDDLLPCTSDDGKVTKSVRFANHLSMPDTKRRDTPERHRMNSDIDGDAPSDRFTDQPTQGASGHIHLNATAHRPQLLGEKKANRQSEFTALEDVRTAKSLLKRKRKLSEHAVHSAGRQKPSPFRGRPLSNDNFSSDNSSDNSSDKSNENSSHRRRRLPNNE
ncbi:hypothetical protein K469DRAFT_685263 [Zopfia rhizophila CBS 207.26]|uniref:Uncharacterized protein n=1 Tax=Zopfia rhizophila CBS 207.26 TaxID=1314779 RepID=A0A6A6E7V9_9PEZI|nr:hypothetical protein K469DRAFT_685263 [Zopfia rhizophila CBS 207.26]